MPLRLTFTFFGRRMSRSDIVREVFALATFRSSLALVGFFFVPAFLGVRLVVSVA